MFRNVGFEAAAVERHIRPSPEIPDPANAFQTGLARIPFQLNIVLRPVDDSYGMAAILHLFHPNVGLTDFFPHPGLFSERVLIHLGSLRGS